MAITIEHEGCSVANFTALREGLTKRGDMLLLKFSATWCKPCRTIAPVCQKVFSSMSDKVYILEIDVDDSLELYSRFKRARMLKGVPALFVWYTPPEEGNPPLASDDSCTSAKLQEVSDFLERVRVKSEEHTAPVIVEDE